MTFRISHRARRFVMILASAFVFTLALPQELALAKCYQEGSAAYKAKSKELADIYRQSRAKAKLALELLGASPQSIDSMSTLVPYPSLSAGGLNPPCKRGYHVAWSNWQYNWENGKRLPRDPVAWVAALPKCALDLSCRKARFEPTSGERDPWNIGDCARLGVIVHGRDGGAYFCSDGELSGLEWDSPEARSYYEAYEREEARKDAIARRQALKDCGSMVATLAKAVGDQNVRKECDTVQ